MLDQFRAQLLQMADTVVANVQSGNMVEARRNIRAVTVLKNFIHDLFTDVPAHMEQTLALYRNTLRGAGVTNDVLFGEDSSQ